MKYFIILFRSIFFYTLVSMVYRLMGKREIGELSIMDFIVSLFIAEIVAISIENYDKSILISLIPITVLVLMEIVVAKASLHSPKIRSLLEGEPSVIIDKGKIDFKEMKKQRYNLDDLLIQLRNNSIKSIEEVDFAILENSGKLSIFKKGEDPSSNYPLPIVLDGEINLGVLEKINKNKNWLDKQLEKEKIALDNIFYCFYRNNSLFIIEKDKII